PTATIIRTASLGLNVSIPQSSSVPVFTDPDHNLILNNQLSPVYLVLRYCFFFTSAQTNHHSLSPFMTSGTPGMSSHQLFNASYYFYYNSSNYVYTTLSVNTWYELDYRCIVNSWSSSSANVTHRIYIWRFQGGTRVLQWSSSWYSNQTINLHPSPHTRKFVLDTYFTNSNDFIRADYIRIAVTTRNIFNSDLSTVFPLDPNQDYIFSLRRLNSPLGSYIQQVETLEYNTFFYDTGFNQVSYFNTSEENVFISFYDTGFNQAGYLDEIRGKSIVIQDVREKAGLIGDVRPRSVLIGDFRERSGLIGDFRPQSGLILDYRERGGGIFDFQAPQQEGRSTWFFGLGKKIIIS
ncbi:MAG: hypothetical protein RMI01_09720, partial [Thermodesulfovibrio sp.]|nr:hypothetical protein [Thermodesulfovibrio sp.]